MPAQLLLSNLVDAFGWSADVVDTCWLDCSDDGHLKTHVERDGSEREIVLCARHAVILESGVFLEDYSGAPLPRDTGASAWPWRPAGEVVL